MIALPRTVPGVIALVLRLLLGALFIYSGWQKAKDPASFLMNVRSFHILDDPYAAWVAMGFHGWKFLVVPHSSPASLSKGA